MNRIAAVVCDTGGTVFDWFTPVTSALRGLAERTSATYDPAEIARTWRKESTDVVKGGMPRHADGSPWDMDEALRSTLPTALRSHGTDLPEDEHEALVRSWRRMPAWPDVADGVASLRREVPVVPFTILRTALIVEASRLSGVNWDAVISCETFGVYKTHPDSYRWAARILDVPLHRLLLVTTHNNDLEAAADVGMATAFIHRPDEWGGAPSDDPDPSPRAEAVISSFTEIAPRLRTFD